MFIGEEEKNVYALDKVTKILNNATWINIHWLPVSISCFNLFYWQLKIGPKTKWQKKDKSSFSSWVNKLWKTDGSNNSEFGAETIVPTDFFQS